MQFSGLNFLDLLSTTVSGGSTNTKQENDLKRKLGWRQVFRLTVFNLENQAVRYDSAASSGQSFGEDYH